jgi:hypothetical protein
MKKITQLSILSLFLLFAFQAKAQKINITAGFTSSTWAGEDADLFGTEDQKQALAGFHLGASIDIALNDNFSFQPGLLFTTKGVAFDLSGTSDTSNDASLSFYYLNVPLNIKYNYEINDDLSIFGLAGPYIGFGLTGTVTQDIGGPGGLIESTETNIKFNDDDDFNRLDFGLGFGAGVGYQAFSLGVYYDLGLANLSSLDEISITQNILRVSVGYTINL